MNGRADLRATAERIRRDYGYLFRGASEQFTPAPVLSRDRIEEARQRLASPRPDPQLRLDLYQQR